MGESREREALQDLITSPGWLLFKEHARLQWGPEGYGKKIAAVMARYADDALALGLELRKVHTATEEINVLMKWPDERLKKSEPSHHPADPRDPPMYRGGR